MRASLISATISIATLLAGIAASEDLLISGGTVWTVSGAVLADANVLIADGKIAAVGPDVSAPDGARVIDASGRHVVPGLVDAHSHLGVRVGELDEGVTPALTDAWALDALGADRDALERAMSSGVTTLLLSPGNSSPVAGPCAAVKLGSGAVLNQTAALKLVLSESAAWWDRDPTSLPGVLNLIRETLDAIDPVRVQIFCDGASEVERAVQLADQFDLDAAVVAIDLPTQVAAVLSGTGVSAIIAPLGLTPEERFLAGARELTEAGVKVAFSSMAPSSDPHDLRTSAALAVGAGLSADAALRAITLDAAEIIGVADRVGSIETGKDADVAIYSGDPLDLTSAIELVIVDGDIIYERDAK